MVKSLKLGSLGRVESSSLTRCTRIYFVINSVSIMEVVFEKNGVQGGKTTGVARASTENEAALMSAQQQKHIETGEGVSTAVEVTRCTFGRYLRTGCKSGSPG